MFHAFLITTFLLSSPSIDSSQWGGATYGRSIVTGVDAVAFDPAAAGFAHGFELSFRHGFTNDLSNENQLSFYGVLPGQFLSLYAGYDYIKATSLRPRRATFGGALTIDETTRLGIAYRSYDGTTNNLDNVANWDVGLYSQATSWLSWSIGAEFINQPTFEGQRHKPRGTFGIGLKPLKGESWLKLSADLQMVDAIGSMRPDILQTRGVVEIEPIKGVRVFGAYVDRKGESQIWMGLSFETNGLEMRGQSGDWFQPSGTSWGVTLRSQPQPSLSLAGDKTVHISIRGNLIESPRFFFETSPVISTIAMQFNELAQNEEVGRVVLTIGKLDTGLAAVDELRRGISNLRKAGKKVEAYISVVHDKGYLVAAAAEKIFIDPMGQITLDGFAVTRRYFADSLNKIGVQFEAVAIGDYKTGPDPLTRNASRPQEREMHEKILDQAYATWREGVLKDRKLTVDQFDAIINEGQFSAVRAKRLGLVDELMGRAEPNALPKELPKGIDFEDSQYARERWGSPPKVLVIPVVGTLMMKAGSNPLGGGAVTVDEILPALVRAQKRDDIAAVVLRIDSPGGELMAAEVLWREIRKLAKTKPVVTSMGNVAASGGYYIAAPSTRIFAEADTITGSIGIFSVRPNLAGFYDWLGIRNETTKRGPHADFAQDSHPLTPEGRKRMEKSLQNYYDTFVGKVAAGRGLKPEKAHQLAHGRVFSGVVAQQNGLVDELGGLVEAVNAAKQLAGLEPGSDVRIVLVRPDFSLSNAITDLVQGPQSVKESLQEWIHSLNEWNNKILVLMPEVYEVSR